MTIVIKHCQLANDLEDRHLKHARRTAVPVTSTVANEQHAIVPLWFALSHDAARLQIGPEVLERVREMLDPRQAVLGPNLRKQGPGAQLNLCNHRLKTLKARRRAVVGLGRGQGERRMHDLELLLGSMNLLGGTGSTCRRALAREKQPLFTCFKKAKSKKKKEKREKKKENTQTLDFSQDSTTGPALFGAGSFWPPARV